MTRQLSIVVGAGSGLGKALAIKLAKSGEAVLLIGRNREKLEHVKSLCSDSDVYTFSADMSRRADAAAALDYAINLQRPLRVVICCAGDPAFAPIGAIADEDIRVAMDGNLLATIFCTQEALRAFRQTGSAGRIVLVLSTAAQIAREKEPLYAAAKWGARGFFLSVREALKGDPVQISAIYPGGMKTEFWDRDSHLKPNTKTYMAPEDVAEVIVQNIDKIGSTIVSELVITRGAQ